MSAHLKGSTNSYEVLNHPSGSLHWFLVRFSFQCFVHWNHHPWSCPVSIGYYHHGRILERRGRSPRRLPFDWDHDPRHYHRRRHPLSLFNLMWWSSAWHRCQHRRVGTSGGFQGKYRFDYSARRCSGEWPFLLRGGLPQSRSVPTTPVDSATRPSGP